MNFSAPSELSNWVEAASLRDEAVAAVHHLYSQVQAKIAEKRPQCDLSGRCCRFEAFGHLLFVTTLELAAFSRDLRGRAVTLLPILSVGETSDSCQYQKGKLCTVHEIRPMGCQLFFCDPSAAEWQASEYESFHAKLKSLHAELGVPYAYLEWRTALRAVNFQATDAVP
jgi:Fe-S-cluster containining protein